MPSFLWKDRMVGSDGGIGGRPRGGGVDQRQRDLRKAKVLLVDDLK